MTPEDKQELVRNTDATANEGLRVLGMNFLLYASGWSDWPTRSAPLHRVDVIVCLAAGWQRSFGSKPSNRFIRRTSVPDSQARLA